MNNTLYLDISFMMTDYIVSEILNHSNFSIQFILTTLYQDLLTNELNLNISINIYDKSNVYKETWQSYKQLGEVWIASSAHLFPLLTTLLVV